nr:rho guanine nucleotide exchange factor 10-like protein [Ciona intestinalis]|eukprot:XP_026690271.1 rho guanine nucleotide exchange factor 10-like protein [Ciona intestinalis]
MSDFKRLFRRQRSEKHMLHEEEQQQSSSGLQTERNAVSNAATSNIGKRNSTFFQSSTGEENNVDDHFKEPKSWRKSFRKFRWKKKDPPISMSTDNILTIPESAGDSADMGQPTAQNSPTKVSKRWSYSPDLSEENVPGARELRGTLERKLSVKLEKDEAQAGDYFGKHRKQNINSLQNNEENSLPSSKPCVNNNETDTISEQPGDHENTNKLEVKSDENGNVFQNVENDLPPLQQDQQWQSSCTETPEEEEEPYDLGDIDAVLSMVDTKSTLRSLHGQGAVDEGHLWGAASLHATGSFLQRSRSDTAFERVAESALESYHYEPEPQQYYEELHEDGTNNKSENAYAYPTPDSDYVTSAGMEDNISWDSNEFDSSSESEYEDYSQSDVKLRKPPKVDRTSKDLGKEVQKLWFWEKSSFKKRVSKAPSVEPEPSSFVEIDIPTNRHPLPRLPDPVPPDLTEVQLKRRRIVGTIISSEESYIESLQRLEVEYKQTLLEQRPALIGAETVEKIFYKVSNILQCHKLFQIALAAAVMDWDNHECIGRTFVASFSKSMVLECYSDYINNFNTAMDIVRKTCVRKPQFLAFLRDRQSSSSSRLNLYGLMLKPVQRFPQFIMIVQDLLKRTPDNHNDKLPLQLALTELETLAERLNRHKAEDEDSAHLRALIENSNLKLSTHTKDGRVRKLLKQGEMRECEHNVDGLLERVKDSLIVLTNDMLICCSITNRRQYHRGGGGTSKDMFKVRWREGLDVVEVTDGPPQAENEVKRETLHSDFILLQKIAKLVENLQSPHEGLSLPVVDKCIADLEIKIRQAEQMASQPDDSCITVQFPGKLEKVTRTLIFPYSSQKDEWLDVISKAKLANEPSNLDSWFSANSSDSDSLWKPPLFLRCLSAHTSYNEFQVQCAYAFMPVPHVTLLWLSCSASTVLAVVSVYYITDDRVEKVHVMQVESSVQCMEHWNPNNSIHSVWLGMESGCLLEYSSEGTYRKLNEVTMPTMSTVMIMKAYRNNLYVGLLDGTLAMYTRPKGTNDLNYVSSIVVGTGPLSCLSPIDGMLWGCSGNDVVTIDMENFKPESTRCLVTDGEQLVVNLVTRVGSGLWVTFCEECNLNLYHLDSLERLQEINLSRVIRDFTQDVEPHVSSADKSMITSLVSGNWQLLAGTSNGLLLVMPLPKLPGSVPKITGPCKVCHHSLCGPLNFLFAPDLPTSHHNSDLIPEYMAFNEDQPPPIPERDDESVRSSVSKNEIEVETPYEDLSPRSSKYRDPPLPRPSNLSVHDISSGSNILIEDGSLYENMEVQSIQSPRKSTFIHWNKASSRDCPVIIACGEGYQRFFSKSTKTSSDQLDSEHQAATILCWKVV